LRTKLAKEPRLKVSLLDFRTTFRHLVSGLVGFWMVTVQLIQSFLIEKVFHLNNSKLVANESVKLYIKKIFKISKIVAFM
jgi:hypothetical protein